jgi:hypothetical protein
MAGGSFTYLDDPCRPKKVRDSVICDRQHAQPVANDIRVGIQLGLLDELDVVFLLVERDEILVEERMLLVRRRRLCLAQS